MKPDERTHPGGSDPPRGGTMAPLVIPIVLVVAVVALLFAAGGLLAELPSRTRHAGPLETRAPSAEPVERRSHPLLPVQSQGRDAVLEQGRVPTGPPRTVAEGA